MPKLENARRTTAAFIIRYIPKGCVFSLASGEDIQWLAQRMRATKQRNVSHYLMSNCAVNCSTAKFQWSAITADFKENSARLKSVQKIQNSIDRSHFQSRVPGGHINKPNIYIMCNKSKRVMAQVTEISKPNLHDNPTINHSNHKYNLSSWNTLLEHSHVHNRSPVFFRACHLPCIGRTDVQWSQIWFNGSEPHVVGTSWRSFPFWQRLVNRSSSNCMLMIFIRSTACDVAKDIIL